MSWWGVRYEWFEFGPIRGWKCQTCLHVIMLVNTHNHSLTHRGY